MQLPIVLYKGWNSLSWCPCEHVFYFSSPSRRERRFHSCLCKDNKVCSVIRAVLRRSHLKTLMCVHTWLVWCLFYKSSSPSVNAIIFCSSFTFTKYIVVFRASTLRMGVKFELLINANDYFVHAVGLWISCGVWCCKKAILMRSCEPRGTL